MACRGGGIAEQTRPEISPEARVGEYDSGGGRLPARWQGGDVGAQYAPAERSGLNGIGGQAAQQVVQRRR
eukprot:ctg_2557.g376